MKSPLKISALLVAAFLSLVFFIKGLEASANCKESEKIMSAMDVEEISLINDAGKIVSFESHIADDNKNRASGYQHICTDVINKTTILFVYSKSSYGRFHMNNVKAPLDIGFFDTRGKLIRTMVMNTYEDGNKKLYDPGLPFQYALEARAGFFDEYKLSEKKSRLVVHSLND